MLKNRYHIVSELSEGGFGTTFLAEDTQTPSSKKCVIKKLKPLNDNPQIYQLIKERFQREAAILEELGDNHPQIPRLYAYFEDQGNFYLVQEWIRGQTLYEKLLKQGLLKEDKVKQILIEILPVLQLIHSKGIIHRDIKPENIILKAPDEKPILIDFGAVKETVTTTEVTKSGHMKSSIVIGTPGFMPLEQTVGKPLFASDLYSLGLTAIYLLTGKLPEELETDPETGETLWKNFASNVSPGFAAVLDKVIEPNSRDRYINAGAMLEALNSLTVPTLSVTPPTQLETSKKQPPPKVPITAPEYISANPINSPPVTLPLYSQQTPLTQTPQKSNKTLLIAGGIAALVLGAVLFFLKPKPTPSPVVNNDPPVNNQNPPITNPQPPSPLDTPPNVTIGGQPQQGTNPVTLIDGVWAVQFTVGNVVHQSALVMKGFYGEMITEYVDPATTTTQKIRQKMRLWSVPQGLILKGHDPVDAQTNQKPIIDYYPDQIFIQVAKDGSLSGENCSTQVNQSVCAPTTFTYKGK